MGDHGVEADFEAVGIAGGVVSLENPIGHRPFPAVLWGEGSSVAGDAVYKVDALVMQGNHGAYLLKKSKRETPGEKAAAEEQP
jgi:hypothetical protein